MQNNKILNILQWTLGTLMLLALVPFTYLAFQQNLLATIFAMMAILIMVIFKLRLLKKSPADEKTLHLAYAASYLSEIVAITVIFIVGTYEIYQQGEVGIWFYVVLGGLLLARPLFFVILKKLAK